MTWDPAVLQRVVERVSDVYATGNLQAAALVIVRGMPNETEALACPIWEMLPLLPGELEPLRETVLKMLAYRQEHPLRGLNEEERSDLFIAQANGPTMVRKLRTALHSTFCKVFGCWEESGYEARYWIDQLWAGRHVMEVWPVGLTEEELDGRPAPADAKRCDRVWAEYAHFDFGPLIRKIATRLDGFLFHQDERDGDCLEITWSWQDPSTKLTHWLCLKIHLQPQIEFDPWSEVFTECPECGGQG